MNGGWARLAIAHTVFGKIEVAARQQRRISVLGSHLRPWSYVFKSFSERRKVLGTVVSSPNGPSISLETSGLEIDGRS